MVGNNVIADRIERKKKPPRNVMGIDWRKQVQVTRNLQRIGIPKDKFTTTTPGYIPWNRRGRRRD